LGLLGVGVAASPLTLPGGWLLRQLAATAAGQYLAAAWANATANATAAADTVADDDEEEAEAAAATAASLGGAASGDPYERLAELTSCEGLFSGSGANSGRGGGGGGGGGWGLPWRWWPSWRRVAWLRRAVAALRSLARGSAWARRVVGHAAATVRGLAGPEGTWAWRRGLLAHAYDVALLRGGLRGCEVTTAATRGVIAPSDWAPDFVGKSLGFLFSFSYTPN
jgi:hypothetical protein